MANDADQDENGKRSSGGIIPWEFLTRVELDSAYISEKLLNLEILLLQVENREGDLEGLSLGNEDISVKSLVMAFEFDILSGIFNSEVKELEKFMVFLQTEVVDTQNRLSRNGCLEESLNEFEEKLHDAQEYLNQSHTQVADMKIQAAKFERMLAFGSDVNDSVKNGRHASISARWKLQNVERQRHILQSYEKSLAKELDLEKKLTDSRNNEEAFKLKLRFAESEIYNLEESFEIVMERMFLAENNSEMLLSTSKELLRKFQNAQVDRDDSLHQECVLRSKLHQILKSTEESQFARHTPLSSELDSILTSPVNGPKINVDNTKDECTAASEVIALREKVRSLEEQLKKCEIHSNLTKGPAEESSQQQQLHFELSEVDDVIKDLRKNVLETEARAENAEAKCELLTNANRELTEELDIVRNYGEEKVNLLEKKLKETDMLLQHAKASFLAIEEQQIMLNSTLIDMGNLIEDLKAKFSKAESRAEIAESKYSLLNETNLVLNEELSFLRGRLECLEASLHDADEVKIVTSRDISIKSKIIAELVMKLAFERERLQIQISELTKKNRYLVIKHLKTKDKDSMCATEKENHDKTLHLKASVEVLTETSSTEFQADNSGTQVFTNDKMIQNTATTPKDEQILVAAPKLDPARSSKPTHLSLKYILGAIVVILVSVLLYLVQLENCE